LLGEEARRAWDRLTIGNIAYNPQTEMTQGVIADVIARVTSGSDTAELVQGFPASPRIEALKVSATMQATLTEGEKGTFEINQIGDTAEQALLGSYAEWKWKVRPLVSGTHSLHLTVVAIINLSDGKTRRKPLSKEANIRVIVNPRYVATSFVENNWQWILTGISPLVSGSWIVSRRKQRKQAAEEKKKEAEKKPIGFGTSPDDKKREDPKT
jgi:hypothetical protein